MFPREACIDVTGIDSITFQIVSWYTCDFEYSGEDTDSNEDETDNSFYNNTDQEKYLAKVFGVTENGASVSCNILNFTPYFYIKVNHRIDKTGAEKFRQYVVSHLPPQLRKTVIGAKLMKKKDFWGFHNDEQFNFIRFTFKSLKGFRAGIRVLSKPVYIIGMHSRATRYQLYESNIDPFLRLAHIKNIEPAGWVVVNEFETNSHILPTKCQIDISVDWRKISKAEIERIAPMVVASFDIECVSSHGDFPVARKDYKKVAYEFFQLYESKKDTVDELKEYLYIQLMGIFDQSFQGELSKVFLKEPLSATNYSKINQKVKMMMDDIINIASGKIVYTSNANDTKRNNGPSKDDILRTLTQALGYYAEVEDDNKYNKQKTIYWSSKVKFPPLEGDPLIQIGVTVHSYGAKDCNYRHIITLGDCDPIDGVVVESCQTETEVLLKWCNLMNRLDPDILTGYNILGFDMSYMYDRAIELNIKNEFCKIGRILDHISKFEEKTLSSSALGDNILKYVDMEGRVIIDVMKVVQRDHKLDSYKLDAVANHFMQMNKHDVSPNDIFRLQKGTSADRKVIADYCFVEGTRVSLPDCSVDIKCLEHMNTDVITWVENKGFTTSPKVKYFNNGKHDCLELTLIDGSKIKCTKNHQFLTKNGWIEAEHLQKTHKILCYPEPSFVDHEKERLFTFTFSELIGTLDYNKSCILMRILGYLMTDGGISEDSCYKTYSSGRTKYTYDKGYIDLGTMIDALNMQKDIMLLVGKSPAITKNKYTYRITLPTKLTKWFLSIDGIEKGKRLTTDAKLPAFIIDDNCPAWILREFLKGLMGGDGSCPTFEKNVNKFSKVCFCQSKTYDKVDSLIGFMNHIKRIFEKFEIKSSLSNAQKNACGEGYTVKVYIQHDDLITFYEKIGYAYCVGKSYKLAVASSYYKLKKETKRQNNWVCERVNQLRENMTIEGALNQAHSELKNIEPIFNDHYSLPQMNALNIKQGYVATCELKSCKFKQCYFPSIEEYLKLTESYERFVTDDNTKSHSVKYDDTHSPCYYLSILDKKDIGEHNVYDIEVKDTHNFVANGIVVHNCVQDCALCNHLMMKLEIIANNIGMANVCSVPFTYIFMRGQGIKIFSLVSKQCKEDDFVVPTLNKGRMGFVDEDAEEDEEGYEGAIVLEPKTGIYTEDPVSVLDYASLYPSSMISENLSHDCLVDIGGKYDNLPGVEYLDVSYDIYEKVNEKKTKIGERTCRFAQKEKGVIPRILMALLRKRKETRKKIEYKTVMTTNGNKLVGLLSEEADEVILKTIDGKVSKCLKSEVVSKEDTYDDFSKAVLDGLQLAYKVTANSLYGQTGAKTSAIYSKDIAACTTATGRNMILKAKNFLEDNYVGVNIVYGDSVTGYTPTIVRFNGEVFIEKFENIAPRFGGDLWLPCTENGKQTKEACELSGVDVWTDDGWTVVKRIIRHNLASHKKIIRVATHTGVVDVTDEHSLVRKDKSKVTPQESHVGDELLHNDLPTFPITHNDISVEEARIMGMFCGNGSCGKEELDCPTGKKAFWALNNSDYTMLTYYKGLCENVYPQYGWKILDTLKSSGVYKLVAVGYLYGSIVIVGKYRNLMYCDGEKIVPQDILCSSIEVKKSFWDGLHDADGIKMNEVSTRMLIQKNQISASTFTALGHSLGYKISISTNTDKPNIFRLTLTTGKQRKNPDAIKKMYEIDYKGYVYDFTTENHRFSAGIGRIIVHNTDSIFCAFPMEYTDEDGIVRKRKGAEAVQHAIDMGIEASSKFKKFLRPPHDLEYEKTYFPFVLISKKRYCAMKYEHNPHKAKFNSMGIALKRRDNAPIVKTIYGGVIDIIMEKQDLNQSINFLKQSIQDLIDGKYPMESLIISKSLRADYKDPSRIAHKALAERMGERDPGNKPQVNDRIPYVYVDISEKEKKSKATKKKILQGDRIEHPDYIRKAGLKPDYEFYITNQIMKPVSQIYALVLETMPGYKKGPDYFKQTEQKLIVEKNGDMKKVKDRLCDLREGEVQDIIFKPFLIKLENKRNKNREITDWFQKLAL